MNSLIPASLGPTSYAFARAVYCDCNMSVNANLLNDGIDRQRSFACQARSDIRESHRCVLLIGLLPDASTACASILCRSLPSLDEAVLHLEHAAHLARADFCNLAIRCAVDDAEQHRSAVFGSGSPKAAPGSSTLMAPAPSIGSDAGSSLGIAAWRLVQESTVRAGDRRDRRGATVGDHDRATRDELLASESDRA
jgi:hypothetical protein